ncbi:MAG: four helix bundle protein [Proteobacteria bacterium]|nr:four helix bundle protein [Pseudomonadota bacterium]MCH9048919.1 four helix bundle protein [Pseudomonadota bacterium]
MKTHKDLEVWKSSIVLAGDIYRTTEKYPKSETFGIVSQMRRAAVSIGANIAEGAARQSRKEFMYFLSISQGSASELDTLIEISKEVDITNIMNLEKLQEDISKISKMLSGLLRSLKQK